MTRISELRYLLAFILVLAVAGTAFGSDAPILDRIVKNGVLKVGMSGNQAPMNVKGRSGMMIGFEVDLANMLTSIMDVRLEIVNKPFPELLPALKAGEVDIVMSGITITAARTADVFFVGPYMISGKSILTKSKTMAAVDEIDDLKKADLTFTVLEGSTSQSFVEKYVPQVKIAPAKDYDTAVKMVLDDKADALVADMPVCLLSVLQYPGRDLVALDRPFTIEPLGIALPADEPQLLNLLENYLRTLQELGFMDQLQKKWLEDGSWVAALP